MAVRMVDAVWNPELDCSDWYVHHDVCVFVCVRALFGWYVFTFVRWSVFHCSSSREMSQKTLHLGKSMVSYHLFSAFSLTIFFTKLFPQFPFLYVFSEIKPPQLAPSQGETDFFTFHWWNLAEKMAWNSGMSHGGGPWDTSFGSCFGCLFRVKSS